MSYKHLFFDWDHTLWDFEKNSEHSLRKLFKDLGLAGLGIPSFEDFYPLYLVINEQKWELYRKGEIDKATLRASRFKETFAHFGVVADEVAWTLEQCYIEETPYGQHLIEGTKGTLETLAQRGYKMHIITNGFTESQTIKFTESGLKHYFDLVVASILRDLARLVVKFRRLTPLSIAVMRRLRSSTVLSNAVVWRR